MPLVGIGTTLTETSGKHLSHTYDDMLNVLPSRYPFGTGQQSNTLVLIHDAFQPLTYWDNFMPSPKWEGVGMDTHIYQMFSDEVCSDHVHALTHDSIDDSPFRCLAIASVAGRTGPYPVCVRKRGTSDRLQWSALDDRRGVDASHDGLR